ncbi:flippase [Vibrio gigantis]|uniref:flippase n=1 Tax=Vibrio gigantis TaxID=296199 RepID=UPI003D0FEBD0
MRIFVGIIQNGVAGLYKNNNSLNKRFFSASSVQFFSVLLTSLSSICIARLIGPTKYGEYAFLLSLLNIIALPCYAGFSQLLVREISLLRKNNQWDYIAGILKWSRVYILYLSLFSMLIAFVLGMINSRISEVIILGLMVIPLKGLIVRQASLFVTFGRVPLSYVSQGIIVNISMLLLIFFMVYLDVNVSAGNLLVFQSIFMIFSLFVMGGFLKRNLTIPNESICYDKKKWSKALIPFALLMIINTLNTELGSLFLGFMSTESSVAYFKVAIQISALLSLGLSVVNAIISPDIARTALDNQEKLQTLITRGVRLSSLFTIPIGITIVVFSEEVILLLFGVDYLQAVLPLRILCLAQMFNVAMGSVGQILQMTGQENHVLMTLIFTIVFTIVLLIILVPRFDIIGASLAIGLSIVLWNILMAIKVYKVHRLKAWLR